MLSFIIKYLNNHKELIGYIEPIFFYKTNALAEKNQLSLAALLLRRSKKLLLFYNYL